MLANIVFHVRKSTYVLKDKYGITPSDNDELKADIAMLATSGRHQLFIANIQKDKDGKLFVNVSDITTDLKPLDKYKGFFGTARSARAEKMARNAEKTRTERFAAISARVDKEGKNPKQNAPVNTEIKRNRRNSLSGPSKKPTL